MLSSGNGRHRRPRQAPAAMVTVAATSAGLALPLLGAGAAHAADAGTWDRVAVCETGGLWSANTHNGFYGGLAITQDTWDQYGGDVFANRPDLASRAQQITVAEKILADIGPNAWPGCETGTGLLDDTAPPDVDPGDTPAPTPPPSSTAGTPSTTPTTPSGAGSATAPTPPPGTSTGPATPAPTTSPGAPDPTATGTPDDPGTPSSAPTDPTSTGPTATDPVTGDPTTGDPTATDPVAGDPSAPVTAAPGDPDPSAPTAPGGGRHAKPYNPTDDELAAADRATRTEVYALTQDGGDSGGDSGTNSTNGTTDPSGNSGPSDASGTSATPRTDYTVGSGDSLSGIAAAHHVDGGWQRLFTANQKVIGDDPNLIKPGQTINIG